MKKLFKILMSPWKLQSDIDEIQNKVFKVASEYSSIMEEMETSREEIRINRETIRDVFDEIPRLRALINAKKEKEAPPRESTQQRLSFEVVKTKKGLGCAEKIILSRINPPRVLAAIRTLIPKGQDRSFIPYVKILNKISSPKRFRTGHKAPRDLIKAIHEATNCLVEQNHIEKTRPDLSGAYSYRIISIPEARETAKKRLKQKASALKKNKNKDE